MATQLAVNRIVERKLRDRQARRAQIISAARRIAELEGWSNVTVRRLSDEISYSQPVLYAHFGSREGILDAVAIEGFGEMGLALQQARKRVKRGNTVESIAAAYLRFAASCCACAFSGCSNFGRCRPCSGPTSRSTCVPGLGHSSSNRENTRSSTSAVRSRSPGWRCRLTSLQAR